MKSRFIRPIIPIKVSDKKTVTIVKICFVAIIIAIIILIMDNIRGL